MVVVRCLPLLETPRLLKVSWALQCLRFHHYFLTITILVQTWERIICASATLSPIRLSVLVQHVRDHQPGYSLCSTRSTQSARRWCSTRWSSWSTNCTTVVLPSMLVHFYFNSDIPLPYVALILIFISSNVGNRYLHPIPSDTRVPHWAYIDVVVCFASLHFQRYL